MFVDINHVDDKWTRIFRAGFMIYKNISLINYYFKKQSNIETLVFGIAFVAMKVNKDTLHTIQYKLRMTGIPLLGARYICGEKTSAIHNTSCNAIAYYAIHKSMAMGESMTGYTRAEDNQLIC